MRRKVAGESFRLLRFLSTGANLMVGVLHLISYLSETVYSLRLLAVNNMQIYFSDTD